MEIPIGMHSKVWCFVHPLGWEDSDNGERPQKVKQSADHHRSTKYTHQSQIIIAITSDRPQIFALAAGSLERMLEIYELKTMSPWILAFCFFNFCCFSSVSIKCKQKWKQIRNCSISLHFTSFLWGAQKSHLWRSFSSKRTLWRGNISFRSLIIEKIQTLWDNTRQCLTMSHCAY